MSVRNLRAVPADRLGYYGLLKHMLYWEDEHPGREIPRWAWRFYWWLQPLRCLLNYHDWYDTAAGLCSACRCGASSVHSNRVMCVYRWRPWMRDLASALEDAEYRADVWQGSFLDSIRGDAT